MYTFLYAMVMTGCLVGTVDKVMEDYLADDDSDYYDLITSTMMPPNGATPCPNGTLMNTPSPNPKPLTPGKRESLLIFS